MQEVVILKGLNHFHTYHLIALKMVDDIEILEMCCPYRKGMGSLL